MDDREKIARALRECDEMQFPQMLTDEFIDALADAVLAVLPTWRHRALSAEKRLAEALDVVRWLAGDRAGRNWSEAQAVDRARALLGDDR